MHDEHEIRFRTEATAGLDWNRYLSQMQSGFKRKLKAGQEWNQVSSGGKSMTRIELSIK
jgi:hypothetical protein